MTQPSIKEHTNPLHFESTMDNSTGRTLSFIEEPETIGRSMSYCDEPCALPVGPVFCQQEETAASIEESSTTESSNKAA